MCSRSQPLKVWKQFLDLICTLWVDLWHNPRVGAVVPSFALPLRPLPPPLSLPTVCQTVLPLSLLTGLATSHRMIYALITSAFKCRAKKSSLCKNNFCGGVGKPTRHPAQQAKAPSQQRCRESGAEGRFHPHPCPAPRGGRGGRMGDGDPPQPGLASPSWWRSTGCASPIAPLYPSQCPPAQLPAELEADVHLGGRGGGQGCVFRLPAGKVCALL